MTFRRFPETAISGEATKVIFFCRSNLCGFYVVKLPLLMACHQEILGKYRRDGNRHTLIPIVDKKTSNSRKGQRTSQKYRNLVGSDQQMQRLEETELTKADRAIGVNCCIYGKI